MKGVQKGMPMWQDMFIRSFAKREVLNGQINDMSRSRTQLFKMRTLRFMEFHQSV